MLVATNGGYNDAIRRRLYKLNCPIQSQVGTALGKVLGFLDAFVNRDAFTLRGSLKRQSVAVANDNNRSHRILLSPR
jgi:hypothetical protein